MKTIVKRIEISYEITDEGILCHNLESLYYVWGGNISTTDYTRGKNPTVIKSDNGYLIVNDKVEDRVKYLQCRINKMKPALLIMKKAITSKG